MKQADVKVGAKYEMKHTSGKITVKIEEKIERRGYGNNSRTTTHWRATNLKTGREVRIKSALKLIKEVN